MNRGIGGPTSTSLHLCPPGTRSAGSCPTGPSFRTEGASMEPADGTRSVPAFLRTHDLRPRKRLGQNFLVNPAILARIVAAANLGPRDTVLEVGAGTGALTRLLAADAGRVIAVELDDRLVDLLQDELAGLPHVEILHGDVLSLPQLDLPHLGYKLVGNLPYYITSAILRRFLEQPPRPSLLVVTVQREVAQRIVAGPGDMSLLTVSVQFYGRAEIVSRIPAGAFYPRPDVDSAVVRIHTGEGATIDTGGLSEQAFFRVVRAGFGQKRKKLRNSLSAGLGMATDLVEACLEEAGVAPHRRPETLSLEEWVAVGKSFLQHPQQDSNLRPTA
ncbi:MAG: ribosomal RNA small subunit methyltransferase A [Anaerolineae bacterium]|nr:ribosomal RNA small subunit methyltransferase A [Anaerolineae bacterium]